LIRRWYGLFIFDGTALDNGVRVAIVLKRKVVEGAKNKEVLSSAVKWRNSRVRPPKAEQGSAVESGINTVPRFIEGQGEEDSSTYLVFFRRLAVFYLCAAEYWWTSVGRCWAVQASGFLECHEGEGHVFTWVRLGIVVRVRLGVAVVLVLVFVLLFILLLVLLFILLFVLVLLPCLSWCCCG
jgi:hypothetical protein